MPSRFLMTCTAVLIMLSMTASRSIGAIDCHPEEVNIDLEVGENGPRPYDFDVDGDTMIFFDSRPDHGQRIRFFLNVDGTWQEDVESEIVPSGDDVTWSPHRKVSISGNTAVVGLDLGKAVVLERTGDKWNILQTLTAPEPEYTFYGLWVDIDGDVIVISDINAKAVYVYRRDGEQFNLEVTLLSPDPDDYFANGIAVEGDAILVGGGHQVFCFRHDDGQWVMHQVIDPETSGQNYDIHGGAAIIGDDIYVLESGEWNHMQKLEVPEEYDINSYQTRRIGEDFAVLSASINSSGDTSAYALAYERRGSQWVLVSEVLCQQDCWYGSGQCVSYTIACVFDRQVFMGLKENYGFWARQVLVQTYPEDCTCKSDFDGDGTVGVGDLMLVISGWNDLYHVDDLLAVLLDWGACE